MTKILVTSPSHTLLIGTTEDGLPVEEISDNNETNGTAIVDNVTMILNSIDKTQYPSFIDDPQFKKKQSEGRRTDGTLKHNKKFHN
jgi:hypothetical protein